MTFYLLNYLTDIFRIKGQEFSVREYYIILRMCYIIPTFVGSKFEEKNLK